MEKNITPDSSSILFNEETDDVLIFTHRDL